MKPDRAWDVMQYRLARVAELPRGAGNERDGFVPAMPQPFERVAFPRNASAPRSNHYWHGITGEHGRVWLSHEYRAMYHRLTHAEVNAGGDLLEDDGSDT